MAATITRNSMANIIVPSTGSRTIVQPDLRSFQHDRWTAMRAFENVLKVVLIGVYALVGWKGIELARFALLKERVETVTAPSSPQTKWEIPSDANELGSALKDWQNVAGVRSDAVSASIAIKRTFA